MFKFVLSVLCLCLAISFSAFSQNIDTLISKANAGDPFSQIELGLVYENANGVTQDYSEAVKWYRKAAEQGYAQGQSNLGFMYEKGRGVTQDYSEAVKWYRKAAEQGEPAGQSNLGFMYDKGLSLIHISEPTRPY